MAQFRKKPVVIEAVQWTGSNGEAMGEFAAEVAHLHSDGSLSIDTLEGPLSASVGDWIIRGVKNEFYPCKPDIFAATYEAVVESPKQLPDGRAPPGYEFLGDVVSRS